MKTKMVSQADLTAECWLIQIFGLEACEGCEALDTEECGGQRIREELLVTGQSGKVGVGGLPDARGEEWE